ncbi:class I SAM-dependent methyltransferase [bacterium]|nr:class I SAM-dependent methyltransferase [bacterium]
MAVTYEQAVGAARKKAEEANWGSPFRYRLTRMIPEAVRRHCPPVADVLDVGCGSGRYSHFFVEAGISGTYTGVDIEPHTLDGFELENRFAARILALDAHKIGELPDRFDFVLSVTAWEHFEDDQTVTNGVAKIMNPGAKALIAIPSHYSYPLYGKHGFRRYGPGRIREMGRQAGLETVKCAKVCGAASWLFHFLWFIPAHAIRLGGKTLLYLIHGMNRERARARHARLANWLDHMGEHHVRHPAGRAIHHALLAASDAVDRVLPFFEVGYLVVYRKPGAAAENTPKNASEGAPRG